MAEHDAKEAHNMRVFIQSLHDAAYEHRLEYASLSASGDQSEEVNRSSSRSECQIIKRSTNQLELGLFDNLVRLHLDGRGVGRIATWSSAPDENDEPIECKIVYSTEGTASDQLISI